MSVHTLPVPLPATLTQLFGTGTILKHDLVSVLATPCHNGFGIPSGPILGRSSKSVSWNERRNDKDGGMNEGTFIFQMGRNTGIGTIIGHLVSLCISEEFSSKMGKHVWVTI